MRNSYKRNNIDFIRVISTYMIVALHFGYSNGWKTVVEFFSIVSGYLLALTFFERRIKFGKYIKKRIIRLYPHYLFSYIVYIFVWFVKGGAKKQSIYLELKNSILEIFMLQIIGVGKYASNHGAVWYISALFVSSIIIYGFLTWLDKSEYVKVHLVRPGVYFAIFMAMWCFTWCLFNDVCIVTYEYNGKTILLPGLFRVFSEMVLGISVYMFRSRVAIF